MMQPMMQPMMDQPLEVQDCMEPDNQYQQEPLSPQENTEINLIPKTPELTPETPPEVPDSPLLDDPQDVLAPTPNWAVTIKNQSGTESVVGPVWVACVMISSLEFVHPETQRPLTEAQLIALEKVLPKCEPTPPAALKILRAYQLSRSQKMSPEESQELKKMQATANDELEALRAQAAETTQRDQPEATGDVAQLLTDAQNAISLQSTVDNGWVTKSRGVKLAKTSSTLCPYSRKFVAALQLDPNLLHWLQRVEDQLDVVVKSTANGGKARPTATFPNLTAKKRGMLHEVCTHFGLDCAGENDKSVTNKTELRPMTVTWTEFACWPRCCPSKALNALGSERANLQDYQAYSNGYTHAVYLPDSSVDEIQERVKADVPEGAGVHVHHLGARHVVVEFEEKLEGQKFLRPFRSESTSAEWWSGDIAFGKWQFEQRAKHDSRAAAAASAARANAPTESAESAEDMGEKLRKLQEMGFSASAAATAIAKASGDVEAAAQALIEEENKKKEEDEPQEQEEAPALKKEKKPNDKADWIKASRGTVKTRAKSGKK